MKDKKPDSKPRSEKENPIVKMIHDKQRIMEAIAKGIPLSSLKEIEFVHPL